MSDERRRKLERLAAQGDADAEERLYWDDLRVGYGGVLLLDKLVEAVLTLTNDFRAPTVSQKRRFVLGLPHGGALTEQDQQALRETYSSIRSADGLHQIPRVIRDPGFTVYVREERAVYRLDAQDQWRRLCALSAAPPAGTFRVVGTLRDRDDLPGGVCLVLANGGVYESRGARGPMGGNRNSSVAWNAIRFEKIAREL